MRPFQQTTTVPNMKGNRRYSTKAIFSGILFDIGGSFLFLFFLFFIFSQIIIWKGTPATEIVKKMEEISSGNEMSINILKFLVVILFKLGGGFVAGKVASNRPGFHGGVVGIVGVGLDLLLGFISPTTSSVPIWYNVLGSILFVPAAALGGHFAGPKD